jgi:iodotyrosine deiodinase
MNSDSSKTILLSAVRYPQQEMLERARSFRELASRRRSVRDFSAEPVPREVIEQCLLAAGSAPSGANRQPWHFCVVANAEIKKQIREGAEQEEREFYQRRAPEDWLEALAPLGTDHNKPFLEAAPYLIVVFAEKYGLDDKGNKLKNYYVPESVGIATGLLINALHHAGLATLTHTPSPMKFLNTILHRPQREKPTMILVVGYPAPGARVPDIRRKTLPEIASFLE